MYSYKTLGRRLRELPFWKKILIIILSMALIRVGSDIPLPFVNQDYIRSLLNVDGLGFLNSITGGSMLTMSFFALSVSPYITASIVIQLLTVVIPALEEMRKDGKTGFDKYQKITRYTGIALGIVQATAMAAGLGKQGLLTPYTWKTVLLAAVIWSLGGVCIILLSEFLDKLELGQGISMILFCNIVSSVPSDVLNVWTFASSKTTAGTLTKCLIALVAAIALIGVCVTCQDTVKKLTVVQTRRTIAGSASTFPIPLLTCSVMPIIFAGSIMSFPIMVAQFIPSLQNGIIGKMIRALNTSMWFRPDMPKYTVGAVLYIILTTLFTYFYLSIGFNPYEISDNLKKQGGVIPGIRPGKPTAEYIEDLSTKIALRGNAIMTLIVLFTYMVCNVSGLGGLSIAGTSCFIVVNVALEEYKKASSNFSMKAMQKHNALLPKGLMAGGN